jgi:hypothetical protein
MDKGTAIVDWLAGYGARRAGARGRAGDGEMRHACCSEDLTMSHARHLALTVGVGLLLCPTVALAQGAGDHARFRFGGGGEVGWLGTAAQPIETLAVLGFYLRGGAQFNDFVGVHLTGAASTVLFLSYARLALVADISPARFISLGTGINVARTVSLALEGDATGFPTGTFIGAPLVLGFYPGGSRLPDGTRIGTGLTLTGLVGYAATRDNGFGGGLTLAIGYEMR